MTPTRRATTSRASAGPASVQLVNHACLVIDMAGVRIVTDPWLEGAVFGDSWELLAPSPATVAELAPDFIWLSHEHPDHFSPRTLRSVPPGERKKITVLHRTTTNRAVVSYCESLGYRTMELEPGVRFRLSPRVSVEVGLVAEDSWLYVTDGDRSILDLNDCRLGDRSELRALRARLGPVDLLATQFGYANWAGNVGDSTTPELAQRIIKRQLRAQLEELGAGAVLPFAAFIWFCHEENEWWNDYAPTIASMARWMAELSPVVVLAPGDRWQLGTPHDNAPALDTWRRWADSLETRKRYAAEGVSLTDLVEQFSAMKAFLVGQNDWPRFARDAAGRLEPAVVHVTDLDLCLSYDLLGGLGVVDADTRWDVAMSSAALSMVMAHPWGRGTLTISGRFQAASTFDRFLSQVHLYFMNNTGRTYPRDIALDDVLVPGGIMTELLPSLSGSR